MQSPFEQHQASRQTTSKPPKTKRTINQSIIMVHGRQACPSFGDLDLGWVVGEQEQQIYFVYLFLFYFLISEQQDRAASGGLLLL
jgi:hypothetical protein